MLLLTLKGGAQHIPPAARMKPLGMLGGTSWHSTVEYYKLINQAINDAYGDNTNPPLLIYNLNQQRIHELQSKDHWDQISAVLADGVAKLQTAGAKGALFCANTPHKVYRQVAQTANIPILHIGDATGAAIREKGLRKVGLIGTLYTMEDGFIADWLREYYGVDTIVPDSAEVRKELHRIVQRELGVGIFKPETKSYVLAQTKQLHKRGAQGIVLGCTEFPLIIKQADVAIPAFDTTLLHSQMAVAFILGKPIPGNPTAVGTSGRK